MLPSHAETGIPQVGLQYLCFAGVFADVQLLHGADTSPLFHLGHALFLPTDSGAFPGSLPPGWRRGRLAGLPGTAPDRIGLGRGQRSEACFAGTVIGWEIRARFLAGH